ncbi:Sodium/nucleoside cotransporter [Gryllus bimaculatus]|nr:Sodium/nucleoside cotransporter [Gryllus bimaculatus]
MRGKLTILKTLTKSMCACAKKLGYQAFHPNLAHTSSKQSQYARNQRTLHPQGTTRALTFGKGKKQVKVKINKEQAQISVDSDANWLPKILRNSHGRFCELQSDGFSKKEQKSDIVTRSIQKFWDAFDRAYEAHKKKISVFVVLSIAVLFLAYFIGAVHYKITYDCNEVPQCNWQWCSGHGFLIITTVVVCFGLIYFQIVKKVFGNVIKRNLLVPIGSLLRKCWKIRWVRIVAYIVPTVLIVGFMIFDTAEDRGRLKSLIGLALLLLLGAVFSKHPGKIQWQPVLCGLLLQFLFGLFTLRWNVGKLIFQCFGTKTTTFLNYTFAGASFVYGTELASGVFAFQVLSVIFFFSFFVQILYYWGVMQWVVMKLGWILQVTMGTTVCESVNTAASIFLGQSEAPLIIKPYIKDLTKSEIHAIMTAGFATVSGTVLAAYISFGVKASHLLTASIMSAPAALCFAKLFYPESEESKTTVDNIRLEKGFLDGVVGWMGELVGLTGENTISFTFILTKIFYPLVWAMGVQVEHCSDVARVVALKTVVNEFVAYEELGKLIDARKICGRSEVIATYALCGFSNPSSIGIVIGALSSMAPNRRSDIAEVAFRAFLAGCAVCFLTACVAGVLTDDLDGSCMDLPTTGS